LDINRAKEIINSKDDIEVTYKGKSVWINSVNPTMGNAFVVSRDGNNEHHEVSVKDLKEQ